MYITVTGTATYTVVDIRKAFEGFESDLRMIARLTQTWTMDFVDKVFHDVIKMAEAKYLASVSIVQQFNDNAPIQAAKFIVNESGTGMTSDRPGGNAWSPVAGSHLEAVLNYTPAWNALSQSQKNAFYSNNGFCIGWTPTDINTNFPGLRQSSGQLYASNGYEVKKLNYN